MDAQSFDSLARTLTNAGSRRGLLGLPAMLAAALGLGALATPESAAKRKGHGRRRSHRPGKGKHKRKHKHKRKNGKCRAHSDCAASQLCLSNGACRACTVSCAGTPEECGTTLQTALDAGGTVYVCPGTYQGNFAIKTGANVTGAGDGEDAASNTILDANGAGNVVQVSGSQAVVLQQLRFTGAVAAGGAVNHAGQSLHMTDCTVTGNTGVINGLGAGIVTAGGANLELTRCVIHDNHAVGGPGGGLLTRGTTTLTDCLVEGNSTPTDGGGISVAGGKTTLAGQTIVRDNEANRGGGIAVGHAILEIAESCRVTENRAANTGGGGIRNGDEGTVTLLGADPSPIVVDNCHENCAGSPVAKCAPGGTCPE